MSERHIEINGQDIFCEKDFHKLMAEKLDFGPYYGHNLNALWDMMRSGAGDGVILHWDNSELSRQRLGSTFDTIVKVLTMARDNDIRLGLPEKFDFRLE